MRLNESNVAILFIKRVKEVNEMKIYKPKRLLGLLSVGALLWGLSLSAYAVGTASGTNIDNQAQLSYTVGGVGQPNVWSDGNTAIAGGSGGTLTRFVVDNKVIVTVTEVGGAASIGAPGQTLVATSFDVVNGGNTTQDYALTVTELVNGTIVNGATDDTDFGANLTSPAFYQDANANGTFESATDTLITELNAIPAAPAAGSTVRVFVVITIPGTATDGQDATFVLNANTYNNDGVAGLGGGETTATAGADDHTVVDVVLADGQDVLLDDGNNDGADTARDVYTVGSAQISVNKTVTSLWWNDAGLGNATLANPKAIPGAYLQYTVSIANAGAATASATLTTVTDTLVATLLHDPDLIAAATGLAENAAGDGFKVTMSATSGTRTSFGGAGNPNPKYFTTANDADGVELNAALVTATFATILPVEDAYGTAGLLAPGDTVNVIFNVIVQ